MKDPVSLNQYDCKLMFEDFMKEIGFTLVDGINARKFVIEQMSNSRESGDKFSTVQIIMSVAMKVKKK